MASCCPPTPDRTQTALSRNATQIRALEKKVALLEEQVIPDPGDSSGVVTRISPTGAEKRYVSIAATGSSRWSTALVPALEEAQSGDRIWLELGRFQIPSGQWMSQKLQAGVSNVVVVCRSYDAAHIYTNPDDAANDTAMFIGRRNSAHFGQIPGNYEFYVQNDVWPFLRAAQNSLPDAGLVPAQYGETVRRGTIIIPSGSYRISRKILYTSFQHWENDDGRRVQLHAVIDGTFPAGPMMEMASYLTGGTPNHPFNFDAVIRGIDLFGDCDGTVNNGVCGLFAKGAQTCAVDVTFNTMGGYGLKIGANSTQMKVRVSGQGTPNMKDHGVIYEFGCVSIDTELANVERINIAGALVDTSGRKVGGIFADQCVGLRFGVIKGETISRLATFNNCIGVSCDAANVHTYDTGLGQDPEACMLLFENQCSQIHFPAIFGAFFKYLYQHIVGGGAVKSYYANNYISARTDFSSDPYFYNPSSSAWDTTRDVNTTASFDRLRIQLGGPENATVGGIGPVSSTGVMSSRILFATSDTALMPTAYRTGVDVSGNPVHVGNIANVGHLGVPGSYRVNELQVMGPAQTGWTAMAGTASKGGFNTSTITLPQLAQVVKAMLDADMIDGNRRA